MKDAYNTAIQYLRAKYPQHTHRSHTCAFEKKLRQARNNKEYDNLIANATDGDINVGIKDLRHCTDVERSDLGIYLLIHQYYSGTEPKKELRQQLTRMNLEFSE